MLVTTLRDPSEKKQQRSQLRDSGPVRCIQSRQCQKLLSGLGKEYGYLSPPELEAVFAPAESALCQPTIQCNSLWEGGEVTDLSPDTTQAFSLPARLN